MTVISNAQAVTLLLDRWSAKDADGLAALLHERATLSGPVPRGGRLTGKEAIRQFLVTQNTNRAALSDAERPDHEAMAASTAQVDRVLDCGQSVAVEGVLKRNDGLSMGVALFADIERASGLITSISIYFKAPPHFS